MHINTEKWCIACDATKFVQMFVVDNMNEGHFDVRKVLKMDYEKTRWG